MRRWLFIPLLAAAVAGPPILMQEERGEDGATAKADAGSFLDFFHSKDDGNRIDLEKASSNNPNALHQDEIDLLDRNSLAYAPGARDFREVFRFDANTQWLQNNWPRISIVASREDYTGYRVPLVTGPNPDDLTGSLTFYFDRTNMCQRISFSGVVSDPNRLLRFARDTFQMQPEQRLGPGIYTTEVARQVRSLLAIESPKVLYADQSQQTLNVTLELNNPRGNFRLSQELQAMVRSAARIHNR